MTAPEKEQKALPRVWINRIKSGPMQGTATSWDGPPSAAYIPYVPESKLASTKESLAILARALREVNEQPCEDLFLNMKSWVFAAKARAIKALEEVEKRGDLPSE